MPAPRRITVKPLPPRHTTWFTARSAKILPFKSSCSSAHEPAGTQKEERMPRTARTGTALTHTARYTALLRTASYCPALLRRENRAPEGGSPLRNPENLNWQRRPLSKTATQPPLTTGASQPIVFWLLSHSSTTSMNCEPVVRLLIKFGLAIMVLDDVKPENW